MTCEGSPNLGSYTPGVSTGALTGKSKSPVFTNFTTWGDGSSIRLLTRHSGHDNRGYAPSFAMGHVPIIRCHAKSAALRQLTWVKRFATSNATEFVGDDLHEEGLRQRGVCA